MKAVENGADERLLVEAAQQDPGRFAQLYEDNVNRVYAFIARRVSDRDEAEDLTAEVFHHALANLGRFEWRGVPFVAWLRGIAANLIAHRWERASAEPKFSVDAGVEIGTEDQTERHAILSKLIDSLPPDQRQVIIRRFVDQMSIREIAKELGRSEGAVKQLQFRALHTLRELVRR